MSLNRCTTADGQRGSLYLVNIAERSCLPQEDRIDAEADPQDSRAWSAKLGCSGGREGRDMTEMMAR